METNNIKIPRLVVIVGPTASGKTSTAIEIAKAVGGEIISADSRAIYKYMDIGTAKPTKAEQKGIVHWGLDLIEPSEKYSVADFKKYAETKIDEIRSRGNVPILVGGTGLYVDSILFDFKFGLKVDEKKRERLEAMTLDELYEYCSKNNITLPENFKNKRYVIRAAEQGIQSAVRQTTPIKNCIVVGISTDKVVLRARINDRSEQLFERGVVEEANFLGKKYGWDSEAMKGNIYPIAKKYLDKLITLDDMKKTFTVLDWRLAKRQLTWLRRNEFIEWMPLNEVSNYVISRILK